MTITFEGLEIKKPWGSNEFAAQIRVSSNSGRLTLNVTPELTAKLVAVCADEIVACAKEAAEAMTAEMIDQPKMKEIAP